MPHTMDALDNVSGRLPQMLLLRCTPIFLVQGCDEEAAVQSAERPICVMSLALLLPVRIYEMPLLLC